MNYFGLIVMSILIMLAISVSCIKNLLGAIVVFTAYSFIMAILWQYLNAPDLAITEAAVGAGMTSILFVLTIKRVNGIKK